MKNNNHSNTTNEPKQYSATFVCLGLMTGLLSAFFIFSLLQASLKNSLISSFEEDEDCCLDRYKHPCQMTSFNITCLNEYTFFCNHAVMDNKFCDDFSKELSMESLAMVMLFSLGAASGAGIGAILKLVLSCCQKNSSVNVSNDQEKIALVDYDGKTEKFGYGACASRNV